MRRQKLVDVFTANGTLNPAEIGIAEQTEAKIKWKIFYDADDILGFKTRDLYQPNTAIDEIQVNNWPIHITATFPFIEVNKYWQPVILAHTGYWRNRTVIKEIIELIGNNLA